MSNAGRFEHALIRELSDQIATLSDPRVPMIVTVERVKLSPDGRRARVLVSALEPEDPEAMIAALNGAAGYLQREIAARLGWRFTPKLHFYADPSEVLA